MNMHDVSDDINK